jgi:hypothetical protein
MIGLTAVTLNGFNVDGLGAARSSDDERRRSTLGIGHSQDGRAWLTANWGPECRLSSEVANPGS